MKTFQELSTEQREQVLENTTQYIIYEIITGMFTIDFSNPKNQRDYKAIMAEAGKQDSVRAAQYGIHHHPGIRSEIEKISLIVCSDALYDEEGNILKEGKAV